MAASGTSPSSGDAPPPPPNKGIVTNIYRRTLPPGVSVNEAYDEWLKYTWIEGGGLALGPPPIIRERGNTLTGEGLLREIPPIGIQEKILTADRPSAVTYRVMNPGWTTFQVHWHQGSVRWTEGATDADGILVEWSVSVVPWFGFGWWVSLMVRAGLRVDLGCLYNNAGVIKEFLAYSSFTKVTFFSSTNPLFTRRPKSSYNAHCLPTTSRT